jgi:nucleotide-binding universal stress UspA family protein
MVRRVLVATDLTERSTNAVRAGCALAAKGGIDVELLHVLGETPEAALAEHAGATVTAQRRQRQAEVQRRLLEEVLGSPVLPRRLPTLAVRWGDAALAIVEHAREIEADLVVLGAASCHTPAIADRVREATGRPVLVAPAPEPALPPTINPQPRDEDAVVPWAA